MTPDDDQANGPAFGSRGKTWALGLLPILLLGIVIGVLWAWQPIDRILGRSFPPVQELSIVRTTLPEPGLVELKVVNGGPEPVTIAQVMVDEAYWSFDMKTRSSARGKKATSPRTIPRLGTATIELPFNWVKGAAHEVTVISDKGATFSREIEVAVQSPQVSWGYFGLFALLGTLVGVVPVALGLAWFPWLKRLKKGTLHGVLFFTIGLLVFLLLDAVVEAIETAGDMPEVFQGFAIVVFGTFGTLFLLQTGGNWLTQWARKRWGQEAFALALLIAVAIGLHNLAEGLAIGAAFNLGAISLGAILVVGFTIHNITEGLAIISPMAHERPTWLLFALLGLVAGAPTILGGWIGGFAYSSLWSLLFLSVGAGAILEVIFKISQQMKGNEAWPDLLRVPANLMGLALGFLVMYGTNLLVAV